MRKIMRRAAWKSGFPLVAIFFLGPALPTSRDGAVDRPSLEDDVLPLLKVRCLKCHGPIKPKGKLNLSGPRSLARGGSNGPVVIPGSLEESALWDLVSHDEMPPKTEAPLSSDEKALVRR
jgi:Planctomycete cytochrome C